MQYQILRNLGGDFKRGSVVDGAVCESWPNFDKLINVKYLSPVIEKQEAKSAQKPRKKRGK